MESQRSCQYKECVVAVIVSVAQRRLSVYTDSTPPLLVCVTHQVHAAYPRRQVCTHWHSTQGELPSHARVHHQDLTDQVLHWSWYWSGSSHTVGAARCLYASLARVSKSFSTRSTLLPLYHLGQTQAVRWPPNVRNVNLRTLEYAWS